ncbi:choline ABC transporter ATP-binding protein [Roseinatronobacter bogoriensis]|uniref:Choline ABC transporter ATP-binding protein n=1 Tax=Roseinatronobacter bogoriensis subsp. barguzinensis TaxID=441209 RepID=A0A2K8KIF0_9RHOB|nr:MULTISPECIES: choline ABC transporter ATP-binding protein [Rhodobaca]ATX65920.1 choline ABC transporter ATP-binding protein [Rhodobaca barguzinensis]MBB4208105.1 glycine betaine/proline transport system ATP-binding protein [Rhodobaca bogoriensis DSM 18756]TDW38745.1 glycine betaine/proline transport system ATP-binding protein [Rhodobaca barguzinensis]TDY69217.1 glycine betaine/proline transport system ATP-binding protein [Rhodobaca bogoriensis DSM 18756]
MTQPAVRFQNVSIVFGAKPQKAIPLMEAGQSRDEIKRATGQVLGVHDCSLDVGMGEIVVLMGLSGSGKSTLLRAVNGLNPIVQGDVLVNDGTGLISVPKASRAKLRQLRMKTVAMVFQQFGLLPWRSVRENVGLGLELAGMGARERREKIDTQLELVGLTQWADQPVSALSGGMQQRVGLARAFATDAPILLMDEPFSALDPLIRARLQDELLELQARLKRTIIFVSHDLDEAFKLGNRIAILEGGRMIQCGTPPEIFSQPANDYVADFVANMNPLGVLRASDAMIAGSVIPEGQRIEIGTPIRQVMEQFDQDHDTLGVWDGAQFVGHVTRASVMNALTARRSTH